MTTLPSQQRMAHAALLVALGRALSITLRAAVALLVAYRFGATPVSDAFFVAQTLPLSLVGWLGPVLKVSVIPGLTRVRMLEGGESGRAAAGELVGLSAFWLLAASALCFVSASPQVRLLAPGFDALRHAEAARLVRLLAPALFLAGVYEFMESVLNAERHFTRPALGRLAAKIGTVGGLLFLAVPYGLTGVAIGIVVGMVFQLVPLLGVTRAVAPGFWRLRLRPSARLHPCVALIGPALVWLAIDQVNVIVDRAFASTLDAGKLSALNYALRLIELPVALVTSLIAASMPAFSEHAAREDREATSGLIGLNLRMALLVSLPATVGLVMVRQSLVTAVLQRGHFDANASVDTSSALLGYGLGLAFIASNMVCRVALFTGGRIRTVLVLGAAEVVLHAGLNAVLIGPLGHLGIALSTSVSALVMSVFFLRAVTRAYGSPLDRRLRHSLGRTALATAAMGAVVAALTVLLRASPRGTSRPDTLLGSAVLMAAACAAFALAARAVRSEEMIRLWQAFRRRGARGDARSA